MKTLRQFATGQAAIPPGTAWYLSDLGEFRGKQELYTRLSRCAGLDSCRGCEHPNRRSVHQTPARDDTWPDMGCRLAPPPPESP